MGGINIPNGIEGQDNKIEAGNIKNFKILSSLTKGQKESLIGQFRIKIGNPKKDLGSVISKRPDLDAIKANLNKGVAEGNNPIQPIRGIDHGTNQKNQDIKDIADFLARQKNGGKPNTGDNFNYGEGAVMGGIKTDEN